MSIQKPMGGGNCPVPGNTYEIAAPPKYTPPSKGDAGDRVINGENNATIKCAVHGGSTFTFSGTIKGITHTTPSDQVSLTITGGTIDAGTLKGTASAAVNTTGLAGNFTSPSGGCTVTVVGTNVKPGSIWATMECPTISDPTGPGSTCRVGDTTTFVLENCEGS